MPSKKKHPHLSPKTSEKTTRLTRKLEKRKNTKVETIYKNTSVTEISVAAMSLQQRMSNASRNFSIMRPGSTLLPNLQTKKQKGASKLSVQTLYTNKAIASYKSLIHKGEPIPSQYSTGIPQHNLKEIQEHWKIRSYSLRASESFVEAPITMAGFPKFLSRRRKSKYSAKRRKSKLNSRQQSIFSLRAPPPDISLRSIPRPTLSICSKRSILSGTSIDSSRRDTIKRKRNVDTRVTLHTEYLEEFQRFQVPGVRTLKLRKSTQDILGLTPKINLENPWFSIKVDDLLDKIKMVNTYSDALTVLEIVVPYPGQDIMMGYFPYLEMFLVCSTNKAKDRVITILEEDLMNSLTLLENKIRRTPFRWFSLGSEREIPCDDLGPLLEVQINILSAFFHQQGTKFKMRMVEEARDGYVELLSPRRTYENVLRCRLDAATQTSRSNVTIGTKTAQKVIRTTGTQYNYQLENCELSKHQNIRLMLFVKQEFENIQQTLTQNTFMKLHSNDYKKLQLQVSRRPETPKQVNQFWAPKYCKNKTVGLVVWNPWISGNIAVVYTEKTAAKEENYVLIWDYGNAFTPEQILFSEKTITTVSFCPQDKRVIIGGTLTGDILVWLLPEPTLQNQEILTERMSNYRNLMMMMSSWIKNLNEQDIIFVKAFSSMNSSHLGRVNSIKWLLPSYKFNQFAELFLEESMQFMSCGTDGHIIIWDVPKNALVQSLSLENRINTNKKCLYTKILKERTILPTFKIKVSLSDSPNSLTFIQIPNQKVNFETVRQTESRSWFEGIPAPENEEYLSNIYLTTCFGAVVEATLSSYTYILSEKVENLKVSQIVHDGPITAFEMHPKLPELLLTVGGKTFAVWYLLKMQEPVFWRRRPQTLISGFWSLENAEQLIVATRDAKLETWNFLERGKSPFRTVVVSGHPITALFNDVSSQHAHKDTLAVVDCFGHLKVLTIPDVESMKMTKTKLEEEVRKVFTDKETLKDRLLEKWRLETLEDVEVPQRNSIRRSSKSLRLPTELTEVLNVKTKKNIVKLKRNLPTIKTRGSMKENVPCPKEVQKELRKMQEETIRSKSSIINRNVDNILTLKTENVPKEMTENPFENLNYLMSVRNYLDEYKNMEGAVLDQIKRNKHRVKFTWKEFIDEGGRY